MAIFQGCHKVGKLTAPGCHKLVEIMQGCYKVTVQGCHKLVWTKYKVVTRLVTLSQPCHQKLGISILWATSHIFLAKQYTPRHREFNSGFSACCYNTGKWSLEIRLCQGSICRHTFNSSTNLLTRHSNQYISYGRGCFSVGVIASFPGHIHGSREKWPGICTICTCINNASLLTRLLTVPFAALDMPFVLFEIPDIPRLPEEVGHGHVTYVRRRSYMEVCYTELCSW